MKIQGWITGCVFGCAAFSALARPDGNVDYLLLTRDNLPSPSALIDGCLNHLDFDSESYADYMKKKQAAAFLPVFHIGGDIQQDRLNSYDQVDNYQVDYNVNGSLNQGQTYSGYQQTGYDDAYLFDMWVQWDLRNIVYDSDRQSLVVAASNEENERHFLYAEVSKRYGSLYSLLPAESGRKIPASKAARIIESAAILDAMSGFMISDALKVALAEAEAVPVVVPGNGVASPIEEPEEMDAPSVIQVDDGQDDTVEKAF